MAFLFTRKVLKSSGVLKRSWGRLLEESWGRLLVNVSRTSPGRCLEHVSWKMSWGRLVEDVLRTFPGRRPDDVLKKVVATSISDQSRTSLRPKLRRFYEVFATSLCRLGCTEEILNRKLHFLRSVWICSLI